MEAYLEAFAFIFGSPVNIAFIVFSVLWGIAFGSVPVCMENFASAGAAGRAAACM